MAFLESVVGQGIGDFLNHGMNFLTNNYWTRHMEQREDNAVQRYAADLERSGLSRTLAAGGQGHASAPITSASPRSDIGDTVMRNAGLDIAKRQQDNNDAITQAQIENVNAQSDLIRERIREASAEAGISQANLSSYERRLASELEEAASRITHRSQQNLQSEEEIKNLAQGRSESAQRILESASRIRLNANQMALNNQAISKGEYAMRLLGEEISNTRRSGAKMDLEHKLRQMEAIKNSVKELYELREGNYHKSFIGKIVTDLMQTWNHPSGRNSATTQYLELYTKLLNSISQ